MSPRGNIPHFSSDYIASQFSPLFLEHAKITPPSLLVTVGNPTQCDDLPVSWTGGQAPFQILVTAFDQPLRNIYVPASAFSNGKGSYSISQFPFTTGTQFLLTMSDNTGFGSGGTSTILTVGSPVANNNCNTTSPSQDFDFSTPSTIQQCK
ncbi:hypothetical protein AZE42_13020 [Rhizopogon vesiculosus]|uniref:Uncharacterized protein n=1 Tax=Rhizopogon vesiculosus TaxID=180088 RepID=A0A1J8QJM2_9AGAM|nr:hypothetical protein AZE42_13020 [Rhizopogon vesiculosus]